MASAKQIENTGVPREIQRRLEGAGLRRTLATRAVLGVFLVRAGESLSHSQVFSLLQARGLDVNRVTLYRLLDRLANCEVLRRHTDADRTWRFTLANDPRTQQSTGGPRFECDACHRQFSVTTQVAALQAVTEKLARSLAEHGHQVRHTDIAVHGTCAGCAQADVP
jgi:Fur family transcriptional regulator, ferric uptake regulator